MKKVTAMTEGSIWKQILFFSIPLILGNLLQQLYNTVDSIIVGNFIGTEALAAVGSSGSIINLLIGFCVGASTGAGVVIAQNFGAQDKEGIRKAVHTTVALSIAAGAVLTVAGIILTPFILRWMGTPDEVYREAVLYLQIYFGGILFSVIYNMSAGILNAVGNSKRSLIYLAIAAFSNIILDLLFVVVFHMGIVGVALATDISQFLSFVFIMRFLMKSEELYGVSLKEIRFDKRMLKKIVQIGLPSGIQNIVISFSNVLVQSSVNSFGAKTMAGFSAYVKVDGFNIMPVMSFSMAATTFTSQNIGAGKYDRVKRGMWVSLAMGVIYTITTGILLLLFGSQIIGVFDKTPEVIHYGVYIMKFFCPFYYLLAVLHVLSGTLRGAGRTTAPMLFSLFSLCIFRVIWITGVLAIKHSLALVMMAYPLSWAIGAVMAVVYTWKADWLDEG